jgi:4-hydroxy-4-methyl-2-oxoglutarate aldolase
MVVYQFVHEIERAPRDIVDAFRFLPAANIADAIGKPCPLTLDPGIKPGFKGAKLVGSAVTVKEASDCNLMSHAAIDIIQNGDVLVIDAGGYIDTAVGGFLMSRKMISKGCRGVVVDGAWRDKKEVSEAEFPVFARAWTPGGPHKDVPGSVNVPVTIGGVLVNPGDIIVGDDDGVVVVPRDEAADILEKGMKISSREEKTIAEKRKSEIEKPSHYASEGRLREMGVEFR